MEDVLSMVRSQLTGSNLATISKAIGADEKTTSGAIGAAVPLLVAALAKNASRPAEAAKLNVALKKDHDGSLLDHLGGFLNNPALANGSGILKHVFGGRQPQVEAGVAGATGLNTGQIARLLPILAPIVMAAIGKMRSNSGGDAGDLPGMLQKEQASAMQQSGGVLGSLTSMLDADGDGSVIDDLGRLAGGFFGKKK
ncbi:MAG TPA: DUF937 domain-containing protein [Thermoanaerobaculia bacterium]